MWRLISSAEALELLENQEVLDHSWTQPGFTPSAMVALFRGDAHEAGKGAARCSQHTESLRWKVLQDTNTALNELRKLCDEHAEDNILSEGDHNEDYYNAKLKVFKDGTGGSIRFVISYWLSLNVLYLLSTLNI